MDWELAACRDHDPELFFPVGSEGPGAEQATAAKFICGTCPIRSACLRWAIDTGQEAGVWGGTSEEDRREMRRASRSGRSITVTA